MTMSKLKAAVIGVGMGRHHISGYQSHPDVEVVGAADLDRTRLEEVGAEYHVRNLYTDHRAMLQEQKPDIVSVATPNKFHKELTLDALRAGAHVLCEKPMAMNAREAREMLDAAERAKRRIMINFSYRFSAQSQALKAEVERGTFGEFYYGRTVWHRRLGYPELGSWFGQKDVSGGGPLIDLGVHRLDLALWLLGYPAAEWVLARSYDHLGSARARAEGKKYTVEDLAAGFITFRNGMAVEVEASWAAHIAEEELMETRLLGTKAGLVQRNVRGEYTFEAYAYTERDGTLYDIALSALPERARSAYFVFAESIARDVPHPATGEEGLAVMQILDSIYESARSGGPVKVG
jgi:predicted dehydrogenase